MELLEYVDVERVVSDVLDTFINQAVSTESEEGRAMLEQMDPEGRAAFEEELREFRDKVVQAKLRLGSRIDRLEIKRDVYLPLYSEYFTTEEVRQLIDLYQTPLGIKLLEAGTKIEQTAMFQVMRLVEPELRKVFEEIESESDDFYLHRKAMADMRSIATAMEAYAVDNNRYPNARDYRDLEKFVTPEYIRKLPETDPWGKPYVVIVSPDGQNYQIASAAADKVFEWSSTVMMPPGTGGETVKPGADLVYQNGSFAQYPKLKSRY